MSEKTEAVRQAEATFETADDLHTTCQYCGRIRQGTKAELMRSHGCSEQLQRLKEHFNGPSST